MFRSSLCLGAILLSAASGWTQDQGSSYASLHAKYVDAKVAYMAETAALPESDAYKKAREAGDNDAINALYAALKSPEETMVDEFVAGAKAHAGTAAEIPFLAWVAQRSRDAAARQAAVSALIQRHAGDPIWEGLIPIARYAFDPATREADLAKIVAATPSEDVKVWARYIGANLTMRDDAASDETKATAKATIADIVARHPDSVPAKMESGAAFKREHLTVGATAPDIVGEDLDGQPFKLSDYRGKVVVIDFWGDW